jgi:hypothetical protein
MCCISVQDDMSRLTVLALLMLPLLLHAERWGCSP